MPDIIYSRPLGRKKYLSIAKHQVNTRNRYSKWISITIERDVFDYADYGNFKKSTDKTSWTCTSGNMWGIMENRSNVGTMKQQFGFFQKPSNIDGEWHGFPVIPFSQERYNISETLLSRWVTEGVITEDDIPMILDKKRI